MCLVSGCPKGTLKKGDKVINFIKEGFGSNRDGSGYMFKRNGEHTITIKKGFFHDVSKLIDSILKEELTEDDELVIHHRIGTSGLVTNENCHPFVISKEHEECSATHIVTDKPCLAHNGYIRNVTKFMAINPDFSDTYAFARYIMTINEFQDLLYSDKDMFLNYVEEWAGRTKVAFLHPNHDMVKIGEFNEDEGYFHSNIGYKTYTYDKGGSSTTNSRYSRNFDLFRGCFNEGYGSEDLCGNDEVDTTFEQTENVIKNNIAKQAKQNARILKLPIGKDAVPLLKFTSVLIELDRNNAAHFYYIEKEKYDRCNNKHKLEFAIINEKYDVKTLYTSLVYQDPNNMFTQYEGVATEKLLKDYYFIPKSIYTNNYQEFIKLLGLKDLGTKTVKKLDYLLLKSINKSDDFKIMYEKSGIFQSRLSLQLFRDYLVRSITKKKLEEKETNKLESKNNLQEIVEVLNH